MSVIIKRKEEGTRPQNRAELAKMIKENYERDHELVEGEFRSHETGKNSFDFRFKKYKQDNYQQYTLVHREKYKLPRMLVHHINHNIKHVTYRDIPGEAGTKAALNPDGVYRATENMKLKIPIPRCEFIPTQYDPTDDYINQPKIQGVTYDTKMHM